ncbi:hypothetical protein Hanom_Chr15g01395811 [Helianthus anomalus]
MLTSWIFICYSRNGRSLWRKCGQSNFSPPPPWTYIIKVYYLRTRLYRSIWTCTNLWSLISLMLIRL